MGRISGGLFQNRTRKPRKRSDKASSKDVAILDETASAELSLSSGGPEESAEKVHLDQEETRWSVMADDFSEELNPEDTTPSTPESPKKRRSVKEIMFGAPEAGKKKKKKKKLVREESGKSKKKGKKVKKKKKKETLATQAPEDFQSSVDNEKPAESNTESAVGDVSPPARVSKSSLKAKFFKNSLYKSIVSSPMLRQSIFAHGLRLSSSSQPEDDPESPEPMEPTETKLQDEVFKIRSSTAFRRTQAFSVVFDAIDEDQEETTLVQNKQQQQEYINKLVDELHHCEDLLQKERKEISIARADMQLQQESVEQLLNQEIEKNEKLQLENQQLQELLNEASESVLFQKVRERNRILEAEIELLKQKTERQQETISSMMVAEKPKGAFDSDSSLRFSFLKTPSVKSKKPRAMMARTSSLFLTEEGSIEMGMLYDADDQNDPGWGEQSVNMAWGEQSGFTAMSSLPCQAQGELLQLRATLKSKNQTVEDQARELAQVKNELEELKEDQGVKKLTCYVENLENEKQFFVSQIDKLQKELNESRRELECSVRTAGTQDSIEAEGSGWFGFGARGTTNNNKVELPSQTDDDKFNHVVNDLNGTTMAPIVESASESEPDRQAPRLSTMLDF